VQNFSGTLGRLLLCAAIAACIARFAPFTVYAQNQPVATKEDAPTRSEANSRITIEVSGGEKNVAVENASVYVKYVEERKVLKDKKLELNVKTGREGVAHVPNAPPGRVLIQVVADGWKSYGRWYDITDRNQTFKIHLDRPPKWY
jgi:hypothetical protein